MSRSEVEGMTLAQKKMAAMIMEGKDVATAAVESGAVSREAEDAEMEMSDDEADKLVQRVDATKSIAQEVRQAPGAPGQAPIKVSLACLSRRFARARLHMLTHTFRGPSSVSGQ